MFTNWFQALSFEFSDESSTIIIGLSLTGKVDTELPESITIFTLSVLSIINLLKDWLSRLTIVEYDVLLLNGVLASICFLVFSTPC